MQTDIEMISYFRQMLVHQSGRTASVNGIPDWRSDAGTDKSQNTEYLKIVIERRCGLNIDRQSDEDGHMSEITTDQGR